MKKILLILILTIVTGSFLQTRAQTNQKITVQINQQKTVVKNKLTIKFVSLVEDSRCPKGANCIQAGTAKIQIEASGGRGAAKMFELNTGIKSSWVFYGGYEIKLTDVNPAPANNIRINRNGYTAVFAVSKQRNSKQF